MAVHALHVGLAVVLLACVWLVPAPLSWIAVASTLAVFVVLVGVLVTHPSVQWFVPSVHRAEGVHPAIAFTFDDGPDPVWTPRILDVLAAHDAKATFFVVGARVAAHPSLVQRIVREGHTIGCHSHEHALGFHFWSGRAMAADIERAQAELTRALGAPSPWFRPPQGIRTPQLATALARVQPRVRCITWSARGLDSRSTTAARIERRLLPALRPGAILTLHDGTGFGGSDDRSATVQALDTLLQAARARNLACVSLASLLPSSPRNSVEGP